MRSDALRKSSGAYELWHAFLLLLLLLGASHAPIAHALTVNVVDQDGVAVADYRWVVEEDATKGSIPGQLAGADNLSLSFHTSYMPVVASGRVGAAATPANGPDLAAIPATRRYYVSVLPDGGGFQMGGAPVAVGQTDVTIVVNRTPIPTAQISVFVFNDNQPINGIPNLPQELGLAGFRIILKEAGGTYGQSGGEVTQDAFGNQIGTTYEQDSANCDVGHPYSAATGFCLDAAGQPQVLTPGSGYLASGPDGVVQIKNLAPAKYTIEVNPPAGSDWQQTSTIEGTKGIDAWVKANEPSYFQEFGPAGHHVDVGFVRRINDTSVLTGGSTITGRVVNQHMSRPPNFTFYPGDPVPNCWVGLNELAAVGGRGVFTAPCNVADSTFSIPNVPGGIYQLVIWDEFLDRIIATSNVTVPASGVLNLGDVQVFDWFGHYVARIFFDTVQPGDTAPNGFRDPNEVGMPDQAVNLRFRDGSIYQSFATDPSGFVEFQEVFPFFNWLVAEVDFARFKATGATIVVDGGGEIQADNGWVMPSLNRLNPQPQFCMEGDVDPVEGVAECQGQAVGSPRINPNTDNNLSKTETGPVLVEGIATFLGQTNVTEWGKALYAPGENGGVSGIVQYATVRAEEDPRYAAAENWEPGIPRVQVNLYRDCNKDSIPDQANCTPAIGALPATGINATLGDVAFADQDNYPFCWSDADFAAANPALCPSGQAMGPEDLNRNGTAAFETGNAVDVATTDSWDDSQPAGCQGPPFVSNGVTTDCYDGLRNFNQMRPAVFDGGYAFGGPAGKPELVAGTYIVEAIAPPGYETVKEEDKNVDFGDSYTPSPLLLPPVCVGDGHVVPAELLLMPGVASAYAGENRPLCDRKSIDVLQGQNAGVNFFMHTEVPVSGHIVGFILDDLSNEFDPNAPNFGEKYAPPWLPVSIRDWTGREISRVYSDQWGTYNALVPSSYSVNIPMPSGVSPNMLTTCMNDPGPIPDPDNPGQMILDPNFNRQYSQFCYTFQYLPGKTTYLDTPVVPVAAFAGPGQFPLDCEYADGTPVIYSVEGLTAGGSSFGGPYVGNQGDAVSVNNQHRLRIISAGTVEVPNPAYDGTAATTPTIPRDFGFGALGAGSSVTVNGVALPIVSWTNDLIVVRVPGTTPAGNHQIAVQRANGNSTINGVTLTLGSYGNAATPPLVSPTRRVVQPGQTIQQVIDAASPGDMILVPPGTYSELVIMNKKLRLQGWGAPSTVIQAAKFPAEKLQAWRDKINALLVADTYDLLPGQETGINLPNNEPDLFNTEEAPGILVVAPAANKPNGAQVFNNNRNARIDGLTITGADHGGGIFVNGYARFLEISNNRVVNNYGTFGGGIRVGHPNLIDPTVVAATDNQYGGYVNALNNNVRIHHNHIAQNGGAGESGGGVSMCTGSHNYQVAQNYICGNFTMGNGGGIGHIGRSNNGLIAYNTVLFNQSFNQGLGVNGGGIFVGGKASLAAGRPSPGSGSVTVSANMIQGNLAGAGDGGGIRAEFVNGLDVLRARSSASLWYQLTLINNMVVNNVAGLAGGGISLQDVVTANIANNTVANNDSTGTAGAAFINANLSEAQPAGIVSRAHSTLLYNAIGNSPVVAQYKREFSNPNMPNNIVWHNRSFFWQITTPTSYELIPRAASPYWDLAVVGTSNPADQLSPSYSLLTDLTGYGGANNITGDPLFVAWTFNGDRGQTIQMPELTTSIATAPALDEGGNWIDVRFGPLTLWDCSQAGCPLYRDYHLQNGSPAEAAGTLAIGVPLVDFDGQSRPMPMFPLRPDIGADERL
jgi:hypothetical protein